MLVLSASCVTMYSMTRSDIGGKALLGLPAVLIVWQAVMLGRPSIKRTRHLLLWTSLGFLTALAPLAGYYTFHGVFPLWFRDVFVSALGHSSMTFEEGYRYTAVLMGLFGSYPQADLMSHLHLLTWLGLFFSQAALAAVILSSRAKGEDVPAYIFCGPIVAVCALHYEIMIYLLWALPLSILGLCAVISDKWKVKGEIFLAITLVAFINSAVGKPVWLRTDEDLVATQWGKREPLSYLGGKVDLYVPPPYVNFYQRNLRLISEHVSPQETILSIPFGTEWYFLSDRASPTPWPCLSLALRTESDLANMKQRLSAAPPKMVIFRRNDKYNTPLTLELCQWIEGWYKLVRSDAGYEFLVLLDDQGRKRQDLR